MGVIGQKRPCARCKASTRRVLGFYTVPGFAGSVHGYRCDNCGHVPITRQMRVAKPDRLARWATAKELRAMRAAQ